MIQIIPAILATSEKQYQEDLFKLERSSSLQGNWVHIDFTDNKFVQNQTIEPEIIKKFPTNFRKEAHLMIKNPKEWIDKLIDAEFKRIIFHIECEDNIDELISYLKNKGLEVGLALKNETDIEKLEPFVEKIDCVLVMSIVAGFQGQPFIPETLEKIKNLKAKEWGFKIGIDGAVKDSNIKEIVDAGVDFVIVGSYLLEGSPEENLENLWEAIYV